MNLNVFKSEQEVLQRLAEFFITVAQQSISANGRFLVALSGGSSPKKLYELLASNYKNNLEWNKVYFFFGDERYVSHTDPNSNYLMVKRALFDPLVISETQIFPVDTSVEPKVAAQKYTEVIRDFFKKEEMSFDLVLLGLGDNSHTASLFPNTPVLNDELPSVKEVYLEDQKAYRITFNAPLINHAYYIAFLVYGEGKAAAVHHVIEDNTDINNFPAQLIKPVKGELQWFLDSAAASKLITSSGLSLL
jgi:6-phosphogluconolactonase